MRSAPEVEPLDGLPNEGWTNAEITQFAVDYGIDLGGATRKAEMLEKIEESFGG